MHVIMNDVLITKLNDGVNIRVYIANSITLSMPILILIPHQTQSNSLIKAHIVNNSTETFASVIFTVLSPQGIDLSIKKEITVRRPLTNNH